jgi:2-phospho-L-lactate guanylyltransferase (CobY/MobA/RfbA family)
LFVSQNGFSPLFTTFASICRRTFIPAGIGIGTALVKGRRQEVHLKFENGCFVQHIFVLIKRSKNML